MRELTVTPIVPADVPLPSLARAAERWSLTDAGLSERIQTIRGLVILLLVAFHAIETAVPAAADSSSAAALVFVAKFFSYIRMPIFGFIAGFVYAMRPVTPDNRTVFAMRKLSRLLIPCLIATTVMLLLQLVGNRHVPIEVQLANAWRSYVYPTYQFWFVQALLIDFALIMALESLGLLRTAGRFALTFIAALGAFAALSERSPTLFSLPHAEYLLPFFLLGLGARRFPAHILSGAVLTASVTLLWCAMIVHVGLIIDPAYKPDRGSLLGFAVGLPAGLCALRWISALRSLQQLGDRSFAIFLYHYVFIDSVAHLCKQAGLQAPAALTGLLLAVGVAGPCALQYILGSSPALSALVLGGSMRLQRSLGRP